MAKRRSLGKKLGDYSENDLRSYKSGPYIDYATGEVVDERVMRWKLPDDSLLDPEKTIRSAQSIFRAIRDHLDESGEDGARELIKQFTSDASLTRYLAESFERAGYIVKQTPPQATPVVAGHLWEDRDKQSETNPARFIRHVYAEWMPHHLARQDIRQLDKPLYIAYAQWIRPERHPEDAIDFAGGRGNARISDPQEAIERRRASVRASTARLRQKRKSGQNAAGPDATTINMQSCKKPSPE